MGASEAKCGKCCAVSEGKGSEIVEAHAAQPTGSLEEVKVSEITKTIDANSKADDNEEKGQGGDSGKLERTTGMAMSAGAAASAAAAAASAGGELVTYPDGSTYKGQVQDGKRHGQGVWTSPNGQYEGSWQNDYQWGDGKQVWSDGRVYTGQFQKGKFHGQGRMEWHTQQGVMIYEGQYLNDTKDGSGRFEWPDGRVYDGEWQQGKRWGKGTYVNAKKEPREGVWNDDKLERWVTALPSREKEKEAPKP